MGKGWRLVVALAALLLVAPVAAQPPVRDGSHDFDFNIGTWKTRLVRLRAPLTGTRDTVTLTGTVTFSKLWGGAGLYEEIEADGPAGRWRGLSVFLYNAAAGQWSQRFAGGSGKFSPAMYGRFADGRGELVSQDEYGGRTIWVKAVWSEIKPDSHTYQEFWSGDGGESWDEVINAHLTRTTPVAPPTHPASSDGAHDFDFDHGLWRTRSTRLKRPLTGSKEWTDIAGTTRVTPIWGGRANMAEFTADGPGGHVELISLRLFDTAAKQWSLNFSTRGSGTWSVPMVGGFRDGKGVFYDQEDYAGRQILVRFSFFNEGPDRARSEQAFSDDGGLTWETNWINRYERVR